MTAIEAAALGVTFVRTGGTIKMRAPRDAKEAVELVRKEIQRRAFLVLRYGEQPTTTTARTEVCQVCGDPMPTFVGGDCDLCVCARVKARDLRDEQLHQSEPVRSTG